MGAAKLRLAGEVTAQVGLASFKTRLLPLLLAGVRSFQLMSVHRPAKMALQQAKTARLDTQLAGVAVEDADRNQQRGRQSPQPSAFGSQPDRVGKGLVLSGRQPHSDLQMPLCRPAVGDHGERSHRRQLELRCERFRILGHQHLYVHLFSILRKMAVRAALRGA